MICPNCNGSGEITEPYIVNWLSWHSVCEMCEGTCVIEEE